MMYKILHDPTPCISVGLDNDVQNIA